MKPLLSIAAALVLLAPCPAWAVKEQVDLTPERLKHVEGFEIEAVKRDNGTIGYTITRDPAKARWHGRDGMLKVHSKEGLASECYVEGKEEDGKIRYWFAVSPECLEYTTFTIAEVQTGDRDGKQVKLIGGGTFYLIRVKDFASRDTPAP